ncbi:MAG TPA: BCCT family transporter [Syntrophomonadaceae bacterium]|nr:BCCT family transporter [Syntrophomonadaceae bacterium]HPU49400.1 BCCT family transporter [Syntrophomonadaceae bacterium]
MGDSRSSNPVYYISLVVTFLISAWAIAFPEHFGGVANSVFNFLVTDFGWLYLLAMFAFVVFSLGLAFSRYGNIRLGNDDDRPEFSTLVWFGMLFGAGMGIGLVFWGAAEPLNHFVSPDMGITPMTPEAADFAMFASFFHWGFHPWANYCIIGMALAYFQFRRNKPGLISTIFIPLLGEERVKGPIGQTIDILAVFATVAGVATSLGLGTLQIGQGLNFLFNLPVTTITTLGIIAVIAIIYIWTAVSGIERGIKYLANINLTLAFVIALLVILVGPTVKMINVFTNSLGIYINQFIQESMRINAFGDNSWISGWRIFYWAWWIAWAPFVGTFIARISRGRTIREFVLGVTVVPAIASLIWFAVFGTLALDVGPQVAQQAVQVTETALFVVLQQYPLFTLISAIVVVLLVTFFVTSANSATFVLGMFSSHGDLDPAAGKKLLWGIIQSLLAFGLLLAGGLKTLQIASIAAAFPFAIVMLLACVSIFRAVQEEYPAANAKEG